MTTTSAPQPTRDDNESMSFLRWVLLRGSRALTCEVRLSGPHAYDVCVVPHWDMSASVVERYDRLATSLRRQAEIASDFREAGWTLIVNPEDEAPAAAQHARSARVTV